MQAVSLPTYEVVVAWADTIPGIFTVGYSRLDGPDVLGDEYPQFDYSYPYDNLSARVLGFDYTRGRSDDLTEVVATTGRVTVSDPDEVYNPHNPDSPIREQLLPLRPYRIRATGPRLVPLTANGWQIDDVVRSRSLVGDGFEEALRRKKPLAHWRFDEGDGTLEYLDAGGDPDVIAYPGGQAPTQVDGAVAGDSGSAQHFGSLSYLFVNHTDSVNPRASFAVVALFTLDDIEPPPPEIAPRPDRVLLSKPAQWLVYIDSGERLAFRYFGSDGTQVTVRSSVSVLMETSYLAVVAWDGKTVRMWLNGEQVEVGP